jgi:hypothetical protein
MKADHLADEAEIHRLKARYCRFIDTKQWDGLRGLFHPDARFEGFGSAPQGADVDTFVAGVSNRLMHAISVHHCHMPDVVFLGNGHARGTWAMQDHLQWPHAIEMRELGSADGFVGFGFYEDEYRRSDGAWKICFSRLVRLRIDALPDTAVFRPRVSYDSHTDWLPTSIASAGDAPD